MDVFKYIKYHPSFSNPEDMKNLCKPLELLDISYFSHVVFKKDGTFTGNGNNPEFLEQYLDQGYYNFDLHMGKDVLSQRYILWDFIYRYGQSEELYQLGIEFGLCHTFTIIEARKDEKHFYHFAATPGNESINNFYLQHLDLLEKFIEYYKEQILLHDRLNRAYTMDVKICKSNSRFLMKECFDINVSEKNISEFLNSIGIKDNDNSFKRTFTQLSRREWQCAYYLLEGKSSKEIAELLHISPRTVEVYYERLKARFGSKNKIQLVRHLIESNFADFEPYSE